MTFRDREMVVHEIRKSHETVIRYWDIKPMQWVYLETVCGGAWGARTVVEEKVTCVACLAH